jgi:hypothetical protein
MLNKFFSYCSLSKIIFYRDLKCHPHHYGCHNLPRYEVVVGVLHRPQLPAKAGVATSQRQFGMNPIFLNHSFSKIFKKATR